MRYFTKEWLQHSALQGWGHIEIMNEAENFSQSFFERLYNEKLFQELKIRKAGKGNGNVSVMQAISDFNSRVFVDTPQYYEDLLTPEAVKQIADIRVLSLGVADEKTARLINETHERNRIFSQKMIDDYADYLEKELSIPEFFKNDFYMHDSRIISVSKKKNKLIMEFDDCPIGSLVFEDFEVVTQECNPKNCYWLYDEIYYENGKYILELMLENGMEHFYYTIAASKITPIE